MPTYEYQCIYCQHNMEVEQRIVDDPLVKCPRCGKDGLRRIISPTGFILKGGGWYSDGYSARSASSSNSSSRTSSNESGSKNVAETQQK